MTFSIRTINPNSQEAQDLLYIHYLQQEVNELRAENKLLADTCVKLAAELKEMDAIKQALETITTSAEYMRSKSMPCPTGIDEARAALNKKPLN